MPTLQNREITKSSKERSTKLHTYKGNPVRITPDFSKEIFKARRPRTDVFQGLKQNDYQPKLLYIKGYKTEGEIKTYHDKHKLT
jgi:hypothetical protein